MMPDAASMLMVIMAECLLYIASISLRLTGYSPSQTFKTIALNYCSFRTMLNCQCHASVPQPGKGAVTIVSEQSFIAYGEIVVSDTENSAVIGDV